MKNLCLAEINTAYDLGFITKEDKKELSKGLRVVTEKKVVPSDKKLTDEEKKVVSVLKIMSIDDDEKWTTAHAVRCPLITLYGLHRKGLVFKKQDPFSTNVLWRIK
jgi:hypothetical protein